MSRFFSFAVSGKIKSAIKNYINNINDNNIKEDIKFQKFLTNIKDQIYDAVINDNIYNKSSYKFGKKTLYLLHIQLFAFSEENITKIMNEYNWKSEIEKIIYRFN